MTKIMKWGVTGRALILALCLGFVSQGSSAFEFVAYGDIPYHESDYTFLRKSRDMLKTLPEPIGFGVFYGDIVIARKPCTSELYERNAQAVFSVTDRPVFLTLGDNDWTDCDFEEGVDELKKLEEARKILFHETQLPEKRAANPAAWRIERNPDFPELARWQYQNVLFATLHMVGTENGRASIKGTDLNTAYREVSKRDDANLAWLERTFEMAAGSDAVVFVIQADPINNTHYGDAEACSREILTNCNPFRMHLDALKSAAMALKKPVLLVHGSTKPFCIAPKYLDADNITRLNGPGDSVADLAIVRVETNGGAPFKVRSLVTGKAPVECLD